MSEKIRNLFGQISGKYDLLNDLLSFGIHRLWRKTAVRQSACSKGDKVLDLAAGTGDLSIEFFHKTGADGKVVATDFCPDMLVLAEEKFKKLGLPIETKQVDALAIDYPDNSFDIVSIGFGIRNVDSIELCLLEMARVLKPGGKAVVLEFGKPQGFFKIIFDLYSRIMMPLMGKIFLRNGSAYDYLRSSSAKFPCREAFTDIMRITGKFKNIRFSALSRGIAYIYIGERK